MEKKKIMFTNFNFRLEETWQMWEKFQNDCQRFSDWLTQAERDVRDSELEIPNVRVAKVEIMKYEVCR